MKRFCDCVINVFMISNQDAPKNWLLLRLPNYVYGYNVHRICVKNMYRYLGYLYSTRYSSNYDT